MPVLETMVLAKMGAIAGKMALKAFFVAKMAGLKAFLANYIGASAAGLSTSVLATGCTILYWEKHVKGNTDEIAIRAAVESGMTEDAARGTLRWIAENIPHW